MKSFFSISQKSQMVRRIQFLQNYFSSFSFGTQNVKKQISQILICKRTYSASLGPRHTSLKPIKHPNRINSDPFKPLNQLNRINSGSFNPINHLNRLNSGPIKGINFSHGEGSRKSGQGKQTVLAERSFRWLLLRF